jgi:hypothetical protein
VLVEDVVCDWLCAASSALIVSAEICVEPEPDPVLVLVLADVEVLVAGANRPVDALPELELPVCAVDFDDISELRRSMADDAAPNANSMAILQQGRGPAAQTLLSGSARGVPWQKPNKTRPWRSDAGSAHPARAAARGRFFHSPNAVRSHCPPGVRVLGGITRRPLKSFGTAL